MLELAPGRLRHKMKKILGLLKQRLDEDQIPDAVPESRRWDVVRALGDNLNAIETRH